MSILNPNPRWVAAFLCLALILPSPAGASPELSRRTLRPELDHAGVEQALNPAAGAEERWKEYTPAAGMDRALKTLALFRQKEASLLWADPGFLKRLDRLMATIGRHRKRIGDQAGALRDYLAREDLVNNTFRKKGRYRLHPEDADLLDRVRKAGARITGFPEGQIFFLMPAEEHPVPWLLYGGAQYLGFQKEIGAGWRLTVKSPSGAHNRVADGPDHQMNLIALDVKADLSRLIKVLHHELGHTLQQGMWKGFRMRDADLYQVVSEGSQRQRELKTLRQFILDPRPVTRLQLAKILKSEVISRVLLPDPLEVLDPGSARKMARFFGRRTPLPIPPGIQKILTRPEVLTRLFPNGYFLETRFVQRLREHPNVGAAAVEAMDIEADPAPLEKGLGKVRFNALGAFFRRWAREWGTPSAGRRGSRLEYELRFALPERLLLNAEIPYRAGYTPRLLALPRLLHRAQIDVLDEKVPPRKLAALAADYVWGEKSAKKLKEEIGRLVRDRRAETSAEETDLFISEGELTAGILRGLGLPPAGLWRIDSVGLEEEFTRQRAA